MGGLNHVYPYAPPQGYDQDPPVVAAPQVPVKAPPQYAYAYHPHPAYYQAPPLMAPPFHPIATPPPRRKRGFFESCLAVFCCIGRCCGDPNNSPDDGTCVSSICDPSTWCA